MRFCMITTFYPPYNFGGDGIFVQRLSNALARQGHHVEVIHCVDAYYASGGRPKGEVVNNNHPNVFVHSLKSPVGFLSPLATQQTGRPFFKAARIRRILESGFDVIHYHNISLVGGPKVLEYGKGIKLYSMHEYWLVCPTHVLFKFRKEVCTSRSCLLCECAYLRPPQWWRYSGLVEASARQVDAFIAPDRFTILKHREMGFTGPMVYLPHFTSPPADVALSPEPLPCSLEDNPYFLFVGRLEKLKGLQTIIPAFRRYRRARLLVAGVGSYEAKLRRLAEGTGAVEFLGFVSGAALDTLYRNAVAVIVPSVNYEVAPPLVIMEAFRQATPAIVRDLGSMPESIQDSGGGCLFTSEEDLLSAMDRLVGNAAYRRALGEAGYRAYNAIRSEEKYFSEYFNLIDHIREQKEAALH